MDIDWFTFVAQLINFVVLVALLHRFLYGPIVSAMDERERRIAARLTEAREKEVEAQQEAEKYRSMQAALETERRQQLAQAEEEAEARRQELIRDARAEVDRLEAEWHAALAREQETFMQALSERILRETVGVARRALQDLADAGLEARTVDVFIERLQALDDTARQTLARALQAADGRAVVRSAFDMTDEQRDRLKAVLTAQLGQTPTLSMETDADIGFGVELRIQERKVAWSLESYLTHLMDAVGERLQAEIHTGPAAESPLEPARES